MPTILKTPDRLNQARDSAVAGVLSGISDAIAEKALKNWLLSDESFSVRYDGDEAFGMLCYVREDDDEISACLGLDGAEFVGDAERLEFTRDKMIETQNSGSDAIHVDDRVLVDSLGRQVVVGLSSEMAGQGGMVFEWLGLFKNRDALIVSLHSKGFAVEIFKSSGKKFNNYKDEQLLEIIHRI